MGLEGLGWRPDGSALVLNAWYRGYGELFTCAVSSGEMTTPYKGRAMWNASWSPIGESLAVCVLDEGYPPAGARTGMPAYPRHLVVIDEQSGTERDIWAGMWDGNYEIHPTWSPDGRWLACSYENPETGAVDTLLLTADGSEHRLLMSDAEDPAWRPTAHPPSDLDSDGDCLPDEWETKGVDTNNDGVIEVDLPAMGADPNRKDVFVQINWMQEPATIDSHGKLIEGDHHKPKPEALAKVIKAFKDAPIDNPDGSRGITLHIDAGADSVMTPGGDKWAALSEARAVPMVTGITKNNVWAKFDTEWNYWAGVPFKRPSKDRGRAFHYCLFAGSFYSSGAARDHDVVGAPGGDFIVGDGYDGGTLNITEQAGTFMHELGHNFGLNHGGNQEVHYKPNYLSVMNYSFQMSGLLKGGKFGTIDYSRETLYPLNEMSLDEAHGIGPRDRVGDYGTVYWRNGTGQPGVWGLATAVPYRVDSLLGAIDWNGSGGDRESSVRVDLNTGWQTKDAKPDEVLAGSKDWGPSLQFGGGPSHRIGPPATSESGVAMASTAGTPVDPEPSYADFVAAGLVLRDYRVAVTAEQGNVVMAKLGAGGLSLSLKVINEGLEPDTYSLQAWGLGGASLGNVPTSVQLSADASETVSASITLPAGTPGGLVGSVRLLATSTGNPEISDEVEVAVYVESPAPAVTLKLSGLAFGATRLGQVVTATGKVTPLSLAGGRVVLSVQRKTGTSWVKVKTTSASISPKGKYGWKYKPATKGIHRMRASIAKTATSAVATTRWLTFTVK